MVAFADICLFRLFRDNQDACQYVLLDMEAVAISSTVLVAIDILVIEELEFQTGQQGQMGTSLFHVP